MRLASLTVALAVCMSSFCASAPADDFATDQLAYAARCAKCHGESGTGTFMLGRRYGQDMALLERRTNLAPELIRHVVRNGIVSMPALTRVEVTDTELDAIVRYLTRTPIALAQPTNP